MNINTIMSIFCLFRVLLEALHSKLNSTYTIASCSILCIAFVCLFVCFVDKVIVGSYKGYLRIFNPHPVKPGDEIQPEDLLLEVQLQEPILQVEVGKFVS